MTHTYLPINISLKQRRCLVVGGGKVALRKIETLVDYDTEITVVAPEVEEKIEYYAGKGRLKLEKRGYRSPEAASYRLVISASDDREVNREVAEDCHSAGVPVNVVDDPSLCDFTFPAVIRRNCLTVAIATDGKAPFLSGHLRLILESIFEDHWAKIARNAAEFRQRVQERWGNDKGKKIQCFERFLHADWKTMMKEMSEEEIEAELHRFLADREKIR